MDQIWIDMHNAAKAVLGGVTISDHVTAGEVSAAVQSKSGKIYVGVCIDACSTLGICAERNDEDLVKRMDHIRKMGDNAVHSEKKITGDWAML